MNRSYLSLIVVLAMTVSAARGVSLLAPAPGDSFAVLQDALRLALIVTGAMVVRALWMQREVARRLAVVWALLILSLVLTQELAVGFFRSGLPDRMWAMGLIAFVVGTVVWRVRPSTAVRS